jgi:hypothetical protein
VEILTTNASDCKGALKTQSSFFLSRPPYQQHYLKENQSTSRATGSYGGPGEILCFVSLWQ